MIFFGEEESISEGARSRQAFRDLGDHQLVQKLFDEIAPRFAGVAGGYTRVVKLAMPRVGDCAPMAIIELTKQAEEAQA